MPIIDLDSPAPVAARQASRWRPRHLVLVVAGVALLGVTDEGAEPPRPSIENPCGTARVLGADAVQQVTVVMSETGEVLRTIRCPP
ncbi:hypothetical protein [Actinoplanes siamensis]|uniref:Uncharacterized protein n=1 Tax=Actinoplanes siamensis TaxID=1223317 RepID=A0A919N624_9ACTN|nr:hypothetical protein [Actinoplanes siamensis]GIF05021.1 hypothetical protein Asi03nite_25590 [Actinoplanes siamensis]